MQSTLTQKSNLLQLPQYLHCTLIYTAKNKKYTGTPAATQSNFDSEKAGARSELKLFQITKRCLCLFYISLSPPLNNQEPSRDVHKFPLMDCSLTTAFRFNLLWHQRQRKAAFSKDTGEVKAISLSLPFPNTDKPHISTDQTLPLTCPSPSVYSTQGGICESD